MIGKEEFLKLIEKHREQEKRVDDFNAIFPTAYDSPLIEFGWMMFEEVMKAYFTPEGVDWIYYYLYENPEKCYYQDDERVPLETLDDLWLLLESYSK